MRKKLVELLIKKAEKNPNVVLITADLGYGVLDVFKDKFPNNYYNVGIREQLMIGMAAGMAKEGKEVYCYSINNFISFRCLEQIRNDIAYPNLNVTLLSLGPGLNYDGYGYTHYGIEDINVIYSLPNIELWSPANQPQLEEALDIPGKPKYIRIGKGTEHPCEIRENRVNIIYTYSDIAADIVQIVKQNSLPIDVICTNNLRKFAVNQDPDKFYYFIEEHTASRPYVNESANIGHISIPEEFINSGIYGDHNIGTNRENFVDYIRRYLLSTFKSIC